MLMMLAFLVDKPANCVCALFRAVWSKLLSKRLCWTLRACFMIYGPAVAATDLLVNPVCNYGLKNLNSLLTVDSS